MINGAYRELIDEFFIFDCRFYYEYAGGHIENAINVTSEDCLKKHIYPNGMDKLVASSKRQLLVFHCEFSELRGPKMYGFQLYFERF